MSPFFCYLFFDSLNTEIMKNGNVFQVRLFECTFNRGVGAWCPIIVSGPILGS